MYCINCEFNLGSLQTDEKKICSNCGNELEEGFVGIKEEEKETGTEVTEGDAAETSAAETTGSEYILPGSDSQYLSKSDLEGLTQEQCRLARNEIYARHGRKFDDETLTNYFSQFSWYHPTVEADDFQDSMLNKYELANRDLIVEYEEEKGFR